MAQKSIQSLEKGIDILFLFTQGMPYLDVDQICAMAGIPKSTCYRFLSTFKRKGLVEVDSNYGKYKLGIRLLKLESSIMGSLDVARVALPYMQELSRISGETGQLVLLSKDEGVCVEKVESPDVLRVMPDKGTVIGLHSGASGKVIMAYLTDGERDRIIAEKGLKQYTPNTLTDPESLKAHLADIRRIGYATSDQEMYPGVKAVAAPIFDYNGRAIASVCVAGPRERFSEEKVTWLSEHVIRAARNITGNLGGTK
jgi:DNA-binding IclR family transcriptional regulator